MNAIPFRLLLSLCVAVTTPVLAQQPSAPTPATKSAAPASTPVATPAAAPLAAPAATPVATPGAMPAGHPILPYQSKDTTVGVVNCSNSLCHG